jgi:hypothetical protein
MASLYASKLNAKQRELFDHSISILDKNFALPLL